MLVFTRAMKMAAAAVSLAVMLLGAATPSQAQTTGHVRLHIVKAGFIIGVGGGSGVLIYHGERYRLAVSGIGIGSLGIAAVDLVGTASNLTSPGAIAGTYAGAGAGGAFVAIFLLGQDGSQYFHTAYQALYYPDVVQGLSKPVFFGFIIATVGCYFGMSTRGGTQGVGRSTTQAVVVASVLIIVIDFIISRFMIGVFGR